MSYVDKTENEEKVDDEEIKLVNPLKAIVSENTIVENPEDVIDKDPDESRKTAFKKAYDRILTICPEETDKKKKKKKEKEREEEKTRTFGEELKVKQSEVKETKKKEPQIQQKENNGRERE